jgi:hypothetical protein
MKKQRNLIALAAAALLACSASTVRADTIYDWSYTGTGVSASGTFTTSGALTTLTPGMGSGYQIISLSGVRNGDPIALVSNPNFPLGDTTINQWTFDDALVTRSWGLAFDAYYGLLFVDQTTGVEYNLHSNIPTGASYEYEDNVNTQAANKPITLTITQEVPDGGSSVGLLGLGFFTLVVFGFKQNRLAMAK